MKKLLLLLLLTSCGHNPINFSGTVIITDIEESIYSSQKGIGCYYYTRKIIGDRFSSKGYFYDNCSKFNVGDTVKIVKK